MVVKSARVCCSVSSVAAWECVARATARRVSSHQASTASIGKAYLTKENKFKVHRPSANNLNYDQMLDAPHGYLCA